MGKAESSNNRRSRVRAQHVWSGAYVILAYFNAHHPNPRRFLDRPGIREKFAGIDLSGFAAPDFDGVAA